MLKVLQAPAHLQQYLAAVCTSPGHHELLQLSGVTAWETLYPLQQLADQVSAELPDLTLLAVLELQLAVPQRDALLMLLVHHHEPLMQQTAMQQRQLTHQQQQLQ